MVIDDVYGSTARCGAPMLGICARKGTFTLLLITIELNADRNVKVDFDVILYEAQQTTFYIVPREALTYPRGNSPQKNILKIIFTFIYQ